MSRGNTGKFRVTSFAHRVRCYVAEHGATELGDMARALDADPSIVANACKDEVHARRMGYPFRGLYTVLEVGERMKQAVNEYRQQRSTPVGEIAVGDTFEANGIEFEVVDEHDGIFHLSGLADASQEAFMNAEQLAACKRTRVL